MPATDHRQAVQDVEDGDLVDITTEDYDYVNPMEVTSVHSREVWETPKGPDILVASLDIDGARTTYSAEYNGGEGRFVLEGNASRHRITAFEVVEADVNEATDSETWDVSFPVPDHVTPSLIEEAAGRSLSLQSMLDYVDWPEGDSKARERLRALSHSLGVYQELVEPEAWDREQARERGWQ